MQMSLVINDTGGIICLLNALPVGSVSRLHSFRIPGDMLSTVVLSVFDVLKITRIQYVCTPVAFLFLVKQAFRLCNPIIW